MNVRKTITTSALALGVLAGSAGIASAVSSTAQPATVPTEDQTQDPILNGSVQAPEVEGQSEADESAALESLASISADDAGQAAHAANPGATINAVQLENENGSVV